MKKLAALLLCLLLTVNVLGVQAFAAETDPTVSLIKDRSFVEIDGKEIRVDRLEEAGYELVLTPVMWIGQYNEQADEVMKEAYEALKKMHIAEHVNGFGDHEHWRRTGRDTYELTEAHCLDFFDVSLVRLSDNTVVEGAKMTLAFSVPYASAISQVLNQLHNDRAWNAENETADSNSITVTDGSAGLYAFLIPEGARARIASGDFETGEGFTPSPEQKAGATALAEEDESQAEAGRRLVFDTAVWYAEDTGTVDEELTTAYAKMMRIPIDMLRYDDGGEKLRNEVQQGGIDLENLAVTEFFHVVIADGMEQIESDQVIFEIPVPYADQVRLVLHQLPDGAWKVVEWMVKPGNEADQVTALTVSGGGTGVYAFLVDADVRDEILAGKYNRAKLFG